MHADERAANSASAVGARAYTVDRNIVFGAGQHAPDTTAGQHLLAHELTHVVQQSSGAAGRAASPMVFRQPAAPTAAPTSQPTPTPVTQQPASQNATTTATPSPAPAATEAAAKPAIPSDWPAKAPISFGSLGTDVHYLRVRLNHVLQGRRAPLKLDEDPSKSLFNKEDAAAVGQFQTLMGMVKPGGFIEGGGALGNASKSTLERLKSEQAEPDPEYLKLTALRAPLLKRELKDAGEYVVGEGFTNKSLQSVLEYYVRKWAKPPVDWKAATPAADAAKGGGGGDSPAKSVRSYPLWVNRFQAQLIEGMQWGEDEKTVQALLEAFLRARTLGTLGGEMPASVAEFFQHVGKSERNKQSSDLVPGSIGSAVWCAQASSEALFRALAANNLRFKPNYSSKKRDVVSLYTSWLKTKRDRQVSRPASYTAPLEPGDKLSFVSGGGGPLTGHVVTVIKFDDPVIQVVSGNAGGGEGSVRVEEVRRTEPPKDEKGKYVHNYGEIVQATQRLPAIEKSLKNLETRSGEHSDLRPGGPAPLVIVDPEQWRANEPGRRKDALTSEREKLLKVPTDRQHKEFKSGVHAPKGADEVWVTAIEKVGQLDASALATASDETLASLGLERVPPVAPPTPAKKTP